MSEQHPQSAASKSPVRSRSRWLRRLGTICLLVAASVGTLAGGAKFFLGSQHFKSMLTERLETALNGRVRIAAVDVGVNSTSIEDVALVEKSNDNPWAKIERVEAMVPLHKLLDSSPVGESIELHKCAVTLHFDKHNHLTTELPQKNGPLPPLPTLEVKNGSLSLLQEGREPFHLSNLDGQAITKDGKLQFEGRLADPVWGNWNVAIDYDPEKGFKEIRLKTAGVQVKQSMLSALPFVSPGVWKHVECSGETAAEMTLRLPSHTERLKYRIELKPMHTTVHVSSVALDAREAQGTVVIEDGLVTLAGVRGEAARGMITTNATLDFRQPVYVHHFAVAVQRLELQLLPARWKIPPTLRGLLSGSADLTVKVDQGKVGTTGAGEGIIEGARLARLNLPTPSHIRLLADATGFPFLPVLPQLSDLIPQ
jgi:hypothetical protein